MTVGSLDTWVQGTRLVIGDAGLAPLDFGRLLVAEQAALLRLAQRLVWDSEEARNLVQATFADAFERRAQLREGAAARGWLQRILVHRAMTHLRRRKLWGAVRDLFLQGEEDDGPTPELALALTREQQQLARELSALPAQQATAFSLRYLTGLSLDEVAAAMAIGKGTAKTHLYRALRALRANGVLVKEQP